MNNNYDIAKRMINTIIEGNSIMDRNNNVVSITDDSEFGVNVLTDEKNKLKSIIPLSISFTDSPLVYNMQSKKIVFSGGIDLAENSKMLFQYVLNDGCYISTELIKVDENVFKSISRLYSNFDIWQEEWNKKLSDVIKNIEQ